MCCSMAYLICINAYFLHWYKKAVCHSKATHCCLLLVSRLNSNACKHIFQDTWQERSKFLLCLWASCGKQSHGMLVWNIDQELWFWVLEDPTIEGAFWNPPSRHDCNWKLKLVCVCGRQGLLLIPLSGSVMLLYCGNQPDRQRLACC